jgi:hypothetical protein
MLSGNIMSKLDRRIENVPAHRWPATYSWMDEENGDKTPFVTGSGSL